MKRLAYWIYIKETFYTVASPTINKQKRNIESNRIYFENNWGFFIGSFADNLPHKHYAIQISVSLNSEIFINDRSSEFKNYLIKSNVSHKLTSKNEHLLLLFYPTSSVGHYLNQQSTGAISELNHPIAEKLKQSGLNLITNKSTFPNTIAEISNLIKTFTCECAADNHFKDDRVKTAIEYLETNFDRVVSLQEIAEICFLSPSRFLHLFKEKTGVTYRKAQQWNKVSQSFRMLDKQSLTETAYQFGFSDSAHYSKVFKETFGFSPKLIQKK